MQKVDGKTFKIVNNDISDGYHTFDELYEHRCSLFIRLCLEMPDKCTWRPDYENWFVLYCELSEGQISYHVPNSMLGLISSKIKRDDNYIWDGHDSEKVLQRLKGVSL